MTTPRREEAPPEGFDERRLEELFHQVARFVGRKPSPDDKNANMSDEEKLRLYGLYKCITDSDEENGISSSDPPSIFQPVARSKFLAWKECASLTRTEAMQEYIQMVASRNDTLGEECRSLRNQFYQAARSDMDNENNRESTQQIQKYDNDNRKEPKMEGRSSVSATESAGSTEDIVATNQSCYSHTATSIEMTQKHENMSKFEALANRMGVRPMVPRGRLDLSFSDLGFAFSRCILSGESKKEYDRWNTKIRALWAKEAMLSSRKNDDEASMSKVLVGLSVRSLFDLYLTMKGYPDGSEILVVPPISVPGMMLVARYHNLRIVPVDIDLRHGQKDDDDNSCTKSRWINTQELQSKVTDKTVAILIVHPFGIVTTDSDTMKQLRSVADNHQLELWEDCAETFTGLGSETYLGSSTHVDLRFFSFGTIKTATALGGGVVLLKNADDAKHMGRLQQTLYTRQQTRWEYFRKVILAVLLNFIADSPFRVGMLVCFCQLCGFGFDLLVTKAVRGFHLPTGSASKSSDRWIQTYLVRQIRKRPSNALMAVLHRRFEQSQRVAPSVLERIKRCRRMSTLLEKELPGVLFPSLDNLVHTFWAFPICCQNRTTVSRNIQSVGFDVATGASQLCSVSQFTDRDKSSELRPNDMCPSTDNLMNSILYLPICSQHLPDSKLVELVHCLKCVLESQPLGSTEEFEHVIDTTTTTNNNLMPEKSLSTKLLALTIALAIWTGHLSLTTCRRFTLWMFGLFVSRLCGESLLRWKTGDFYVKESTAFAESCDMIDAVYDGDKTTSKSDSSSETVSNIKQHGVMDSMDSLRLSIASNSNGTTSKRKVIVTGATGFVGSALLRDLLVHREILSLETIIIICRTKRDLSAESRIQRLLNKPIFQFLTEAEKMTLIQVVEGDVTMNSAGLSPMNLAEIVQDPNITHVFHCAAAVSFTLEFPNAAQSNITSSLNMQSLTGRLKNKDAQFVHISTAFVHGDKIGSKESPLPEELFDFESFDPNEIYRSMVGTQYYASKAMAEMNFPNTYSFSKSVCEHLLSQNSHVDTLIIRPSIVGPAIEAPFEGWAGDRPSTIVAGPCLHLSQQWNIWHLGKQRATCFPVDILARFILVKAFNEDSDRKGSSSNDGASSSDGSFERISATSDEYSEGDDTRSTVSSQNTVDCRIPKIFNATWDTGSSQNALFSWLEFSVAYLHLGSVFGYFSRSSAMMQLLISAQLIPAMQPSNETFTILQSFLVRFPFELTKTLYEYIGLSSLKLTKLLTFLDLPLLFYPFVKTEFYFESDLTAPENFDVKRYSFSCGVAAHRFISSKQGSSKQGSKDSPSSPSDSLKKMSSFAVGGRYHPHRSSYFWWALCQPKGDILLRIVAALVGYLLWAISTVVTVDLTSFRTHLSAIRSKATKDPVHLVLAPTHRSFFDFVLLSYVFFSLPELQVDLPFIVAADEFQHLPVIGWLARQLRAFYIQRGKGRVDSSLSKKLESLKDQHLGATFEVFIEGRRSRDRRFVDPKTGLLKSLKNSGGEHIILPITINYESIPEQNILSEEAGGSNRRMLSVTGMFLWLKEVVKGSVKIGKIHIVANDPISLDCKSDADFKQLVNAIQKGQQQEIMVSEYHIRAASKLLNVEYSILARALSKLGCRFWPEVHVGGLPELPMDSSNLLTIMLHFGHILAPLFLQNRGKWSTWLSRMGSSGVPESIAFDKDIQELYNQLGSLFDDADTAVGDAISILAKRGFADPDCDHVLQGAEAMSRRHIPTLILRAAVLLRIPGRKQNDCSSLLSQLPIASIVDANNLTNSDENLGFWGFRDSGFIARTDDRGRRYVTMKGTRYALCGKRMTKLLPFIESALRIKINTAKEFTTLHPKWYHSDEKTGLSTEDQRYLGALAQGRLSFSTIDRLRHGTGHSQEDVFAIRNGENIRIPDAVLWPTSEDQVRAIVNAAKAKSWCLIPHGGGTNVIEATRCPPKDIEPRPILSVSTKNLNRILWLNEEDGLAHVEAGITGRDLVELLEQRGYTMGHEPDSIEFSTLGGWIATKASGMKRSKYGNIEDIVVSARIVGPNGGLLWKGSDSDQKVVAGRHSEGLDVQTLAFGSEGCLGIITSAVIRIWPLPQVRAFDSVVFPNFEDGLRFVRAVAREPRRMPACVRLLDNAHFRLGQALRPDGTSWWHHAKDVLSKSLASIMYDFDSESVVCATISYEGNESEVKGQKAALSNVAKIHGGLMLGSKLGKAGYELTYMIAYLRDFAMTYHVLGESFETFCPWSRIETLIAATKQRIITEHTARMLPGVPFVGCRVTQLYHEGACLYFYLCIGFEGIGNDRASTVYSELEKAARDEILKQGGSLSHHHGLGKLRASFAKNRSSCEFQSAVASIKDGIDEDNVFGARNGLFAP